MYRTIDLNDVDFNIYDAPIGVSVSGGADSALVLFLLMKYCKNHITIFSTDTSLIPHRGVIAKNIVNKSKVFDNLEPALKNIDYIIATSARFRNKNIKHIQLEDLKQIDFTKKVAFLFGSEASGLSNNEVSYANYTLQIPTNPEFKSLNLSHSLIIIAQYVSGIIKSKTSNFKKSKKVK